MEPGGIVRENGFRVCGEPVDRARAGGRRGMALHGAMRREAGARRTAADKACDVPGREERIREIDAGRGDRGGVRAGRARRAETSSTCTSAASSGSGTSRAPSRNLCSGGSAQKRSATPRRKRVPNCPRGPSLPEPPPVCHAGPPVRCPRLRLASPPRCQIRWPRLPRGRRP